MTFVPDVGDLNTGDVAAEAWFDAVRENFIAMSTWGTYTPTLTQSGTVTKTVTQANYVRLGDLVICQVALAATGSGTANNAIIVTLPVNALHTGFQVGNGHWFDTSATQNYQTHAYLYSATQLIFYRVDTTTASAIGVDPNLALASGDIVDFTVIYQAT